MFKKFCILAILFLAAFLILNLSFSYERFSRSSLRNIYNVALPDRDPIDVDSHPDDDEVPCVKLDVDITPSIVAAGSPVLLSMMVENCSGEILKLEIYYTIREQSSTITLLMAKSFLPLASNETIKITHERNIPANAPAGSYVIIVEAKVNGMLVAEDSVELTIL